MYYFLLISENDTGLNPWNAIGGGGGGEQHANNKSLINQSEQNAILRNVSYQLSTPMPFSPEIKNGGGSPSGQAIGAASGGVDTKCISLCRKVGIDPLDLVFWMQNLRIWLRHRRRCPARDQTESRRRETSSAEQNIQNIQNTQNAQNTPNTPQYLRK